MTYEESLAKTKELIQAAKSVAVVTHENPTFDSMGASLALYLGLTSLGKNVTIVCPDPMTVELSNFVAADKVINELGKKNFIVSLDYVDGSIEKVSYNIEGNKFNLVIEPRAGFEPFSADKVHYSYDGAATDVILVVDTIHLGGLKKLYEGNKDFFATKPIINLDCHPNNAQYGQVNLVDSGASSTVELAAELLATLGVKLTADIGTNLLNAVYAATNNFQNPNVTAMAFEVASVCLKTGAKRFAPSAGEGVLRGVLPSQPVPIVQKQPAQPVPPPAAGPVAPASPITPAAPTAVSQPPPPKPAAQPPAPAPADWLKPKIFKSSGSLL